MKIMETFAAAAAVALLAGCSDKIDNAAVISGIVPAPNEIVAVEGSFGVKGASFDLSGIRDEKSSEMVKGFVGQLSKTSGKKSKIVEGKADFVFETSDAIVSEGYGISVTESGVTVRAADFNGFFYAVQTLKQMLPASIYGNVPVSSDAWSLPCCKIKDSPRFGYRGVLIDDCRHFFGKEEIKRVLDIMSVYKLNRLHWHLTEDQGWRIEIKKYPRLTEIGAWRDGTQVGKDRDSSDGIRYGGFYTQDEIREIVAYAESLGITIIPEIDLPGHMVAALTAYPWLGCSGGPYSVRTSWGIADEALCPGKETTFEFLEDVLGEVADLFPSEYFNIGGDECRKEEWKRCRDCQNLMWKLGLKTDENATREQRLQNYVTARVQAFLATKGKKIIGWDEILEGELAEGATVMSWRGSAGGIKAAQMGYDVVMSPNNYCYLDYAQSPDLESEPLCWTSDPERALTIEKVYSLDPCQDIPEEFQHHILGVQGNLWTEYVPTPEHLEYMLLPRMLALSEVQWCDADNRDFDRFTDATKGHEYRVLDILGYNFRR